MFLLQVYTLHFTPDCYLYIVTTLHVTEHDSE